MMERENNGVEFVAQIIVQTPPQTGIIKKI